MKGIILHGGHGTRLRPLTYSRPKQLLPIANTPMSEYGLMSLKKSGITEIAIVIGGDNSNKVKEYYGDGGKFGVNVTYIHQNQPLGISHAIGLCEDFIRNEKFVVFLGDNILLKEISEYVKQFNKSDDAAKILLCEVSNPQQFGIADLTNEGKIKKIIEKPKNPPTNFAVIGIYFLTPIIFKIIKKLKPSWRNELEITDALQMLLESNEKISYDIITKYWKDTGTLSDILDANKTILENANGDFKGQKDEMSITTGNVIIGSNTAIKNHSSITGPVMIGENCIIDGAKIGPNVSIGKNCKIIQASIKDSIIMDESEINGRLNLSESIIAYNSKIIINKENNSRVVLGENNILEI